MFEKYFKANKGFTLIELLTVLAIIGLLVVIILAVLQEPRGNARDAKRKADLRSLGTAMELCYGDENCESADAYIQYINYTNARVGGIGSFVSSINMPDDPAGVSYEWVDNTGDNQTFCIYTDLENGPMVFVSESGYNDKIADGSDDADCP